MSEQTSTAKMPHERRVREEDYADFREHIAASCRYAERKVGEYYELHDTYRDPVTEVNYYAALAGLRRVIGRDDATHAALTGLLNACGARERQMAYEAAMDAFIAGYNYAVEAITGKPPVVVEPAARKDGEAA